MCGICGKLRTDGKSVDEGMLRKMTSVLSHRGPDDGGVHISAQGATAGSQVNIGLGHRRLSIIDLSAAGRQPMSNEDKSIWIVFNGEIYNFQSLRAELESKGHRFHSHTDTEAIIHLYEEEGIDTVKRLVGMFAFALWDERKQTLLLCRDHIGIKPLVYSWDGNTLVFASEIKGILEDTDVKREMDWDALNLYLTFNYIPAPYTIFKSIRKLSPGHILVFQNGEVREDAYWNIDLNPRVRSTEMDFDACKRELFKTLEEAVRMQMIADVPLGAFLSGGIDSSIIVGLMARNSSRPVETYTIGYKDMPMFDETAYARDVALLNRTDHHEIKLDARDIMQAVPQVLASFDEPFGDSSAVPTFVVSRETRKGVTVALSGDGGDELFAGYRMYKGEDWYRGYRLLPSFLRKQLIEPFLMSLSDSRDEKFSEYVRRSKKFVRGAKDTFAERVFTLNEIFSRDLRRVILHDSKTADYDLGMKLTASRLNEMHDGHINSMLYADLKQSLPGDMLTKVDAMSMFHALEVRVPLLDHRVCELAFSMRGDWKLHNGKSKYVLVETFKDILPPSLHNRPKWGFEMPISKWLKTDLRYLIEKYLSKDFITRQGIFNYAAIEELVNNLMSNRVDTSWHIWNLIVFQVWHGQYGNN
jgi:asparagine synthase (glutamine-hydrolysing)